MHTYETLFITAPTLTEEEEQVTTGDLARVVTEGGGTFFVNERMGRRRLGYPIRKFNDGVYVRFMYDSEPSVPAELERRLRLTDRVLRSLTVRLEPEWAVAAKEQEVRDVQARLDAAAREKERLEREALEGQERQARADSGDSDNDRDEDPDARDGSDETED